MTLPKEDEPDESLTESLMRRSAERVTKKLLKKETARHRRRILVIEGRLLKRLKCP
jgi:hypothetical protein